MIKNNNKNNNNNNNNIKLSCSLFAYSIYSELDSSGSVKNLTKRISVKRKYGGVKLHILFNK